MAKADKKKDKKSKAQVARKTLVTLLLDRSGSMQSHKTDTLGAINAYYEELRADKGDTRLTFVQFDTAYDERMSKHMRLEKLFVARPVLDLVDLAPEDYRPHGGTPLIDAACTTIRAIEESLEGRDDVQVVVAIQTDGQENDSVENSWDDLKALIAEKEAKGWQFNFMGAGINAYDQGMRMGLKKEKIISYGTNHAETTAAFRAMGANTRCYASGEMAEMAYTDLQKFAAGDLG